MNRPLVIAHRGFTKNAGENTLAAIQAALDLKVDGIEVDLRMTRDGTILVFHDDTLARLAGNPLEIEKSDYQQIRNIRVFGERIPTLQDLLDLVQDRCLLNLEVKTVLARPTHERKIIDILRAKKLADSILLSAFNPLALLRLRWLAPEINRGYLYAKKSSLRPWLTPVMKLYSLHGSLDTLHPNLVARCHHRGKRFFVWTVNRENDMKAMIRLGVDGIISDHPDRLLDILT